MVDVNFDISANVVTNAALELAKIIRIFLESQPNYKEKQLEAFYEFQKKLKEEIARPDRDHSDVIYWNQLQQLFIHTILAEIAPKS